MRKRLFGTLYTVLLLPMLVAGCGDSASMPADASGDGGTPPQATLPADVCLVPGCSCGSGEDEGAVGPVPEAGELGHWAAAHVPLPTTPYLVTEVVFGLVHSDFDTDTSPCNPGFNSTVQLFTSTDATPPASPEVRWMGETPGLEGSSLSIVSLPVDPPMRVEAGEELFVSLQMAGTTEAYTCAYSCGTVGVAVSDASWWSGAQVPPYTWRTLTSFGLSMGYQMGVNGMPAE